MWTDKDLLQIENKGISTEQLLDQLDLFKRGFPYLSIVSSASIEKGIKSIPNDKLTTYIEIWNTYLDEKKEIVKFVPASGAASRMFKDLFEFLDAEHTTPTSDFEKTFFTGIRRFAFYDALNKSCIQTDGKSVEQLMQAGDYKTVVRNLLTPSGLNYGQLPKGLLHFHSYPEGPRTAMEEHLVEGALYTSNKGGTVNIHFTVSEEHKALFKALINQKQTEYEKTFDVRFRLSFSEQKASTDTIAADSNNKPFRENNQLVFRPGGHGALIENLNDIEADLVFIKNIDNVVPDQSKPITTTYKQLLGGLLVHYQRQIFEYLQLLDSKEYTEEQLSTIRRFTEDELCVSKPDVQKLNKQELASYLYTKLNRPLRVCGMVRNQGEPGGGPFIAINPDGSQSLQILESSQIDFNDPKKKALFEQGTHFNPVDLVCGLRDYKGQAYDLLRYVDRNTGFISIKSKSGKELKALELPGLWNGAMSDWNTVFVEVPIETFNPVKTVNDLLMRE